MQWKFVVTWTRVLFTPTAW